MKPNYKRKEKRGSDRRLAACASGKLMPLGTVGDPVFASKLYGEGIAIIPDDDLIVAPCSATVVMIPYTRQSIGLENEQGDMILIHVGTNAAQYRGRGFESLVMEGGKVRAGTPLIRLDRKFLDAQNADLTTCMVITNLRRPDDYRILEGDQVIAGRTPVMERRS